MLDSRNMESNFLQFRTRNEKQMLNLKFSKHGKEDGENGK